MYKNVNLRGMKMSDNNKPTNMLQTGILSIITGFLSIFCQPLFGESLNKSIPISLFCFGGYGLYWYYSTKSK